MTNPTPDSELRIVAPRRSVARHIADVWRYRQLLGQLVRRELRVRYQKSALGLAWSLANPLFLMAVYSIVFNILGSSIPAFSIWILAGLLVWNFFATSLSVSTQSITSNSYLVGKVNFPREVLPLAAIGSALVHFFISSGVFTLVLLALRFQVDWAYLWLVLPAMVVIVLLASGLGILLGAANVYARDTSHLLDLVILAWFWLTPILYPFDLLSGKLVDWGLPGTLHLLNPLTPMVIAVQRGVYGTPAIWCNPANGSICSRSPVDGYTKRFVLPDLSQWWYLRNIAVGFVIALAILTVAIKVFDRAEANFAEVM